MHLVLPTVGDIMTDFAESISQELTNGGPCCLSILHIVVYICYSQTPNLSPLFPLW